MLRQAIEGFEDIIEDNEPKNSVIMVEGPPGSLKSTFVFTALMNHTKRTNTKGLYLTLEESKKRQVSNLQSMDIIIDENSPVKIVDYQYSRKLARLEGKAGGELNWIIDSIREYNKEHEDVFSCLVIDSLNVLYTMIDELRNRSEVYFFFEELRKLNATIFIVAELPQNTRVGLDGSLMGSELFLCDGLVELGMMEVDNKIKRYVQVRKLRGAKHSLGKYSIDIVPGKGVVALEELIV